MTVKIKMEVEPELMETLESLEEDSLAVICDDEMENRIHYLEELVRGWKSYRNVNRKHRRVLFLMLCSKNKEALLQYEELVLHPKLLEMERAAQLQKVPETSQSSDVASTTSTVGLGADGSDNSAGEDSPESPTSKTAEALANHLHKLVRDDQAKTLLVQSDGTVSEVLNKTSSFVSPTHGNTKKKNAHQQLTTKQGEMVDNALEELERSLLAERNRNPECSVKLAANQISLLSNQVMPKYSQTQLDSLREACENFHLTANARTEGKDSISDKTAMAQNILQAVGQVRKAIDHVEEIQAAANNQSSGFSANDLVRLETKLMQSVALLMSSECALKPIPEESEVEDKGENGVEEIQQKSRTQQLVEKNGHVQLGNDVDDKTADQVKGDTSYETMSVGQRKRAKKAARKAATKVAEAAEAQRKLKEEQENEQRQAMLAAEALVSLGMLTLSPEEQRRKQLLELSQKLSKDCKVPISGKEVETYMKIKRNGQDVLVHSEEEAVMKKMSDNNDQIQATLMGAIRKEHMDNQKLIQRLEQAGMTIAPDVDIHRNPENNEVWHVAKDFVLRKLAFWKNSKDPQAPHYVEMYLYLFSNLSTAICELIFKFLPIEANPEAHFEQTLLIHYQAGKFPSGKTTDDIPV